MEPEKETKILFSETVRPPLWLLAFIFFLLASVALSLWAAFDNRTGLIALVASVLAIPFINNAMLLKITIDENELRVGRAHIERTYLGLAQPLTIDEMRLTRGREADPSAHLALRFWQPRGVRIAIHDSRDSTPYWLVSSKNSKGLVEALKKGPKS